jgi:hypothetical protein
LKKRGVVAVRQIASCHFGGATEVDANHSGAPSVGDVSKPTHSTSNIQNEFSTKFIRRKTSALTKRNLGVVIVCAIELRARILVPLKPKTFGVVLLVHESNHSVDLGKQSATIWADKSRAIFDQSPPARRAAQDIQQFSTKPTPAGILLLARRHQCLP